MRTLRPTIHIDPDTSELRERCETCEGEGRITTLDDDDDGRTVEVYSKCQPCKGLGYLLPAADGDYEALLALGRMVSLTNEAAGQLITTHAEALVKYEGSRLSAAAGAALVMERDGLRRELDGARRREVVPHD